MAGRRDGISVQTTSSGGRVGTTVFLLVFLAFGVGGSILILAMLLKDESTRSWSNTPCRIESSSYELPKGNSDGYRLQIRYRYSAAGQEHVGTLFNRSNDDHHDFETIQRALLEFPAQSSAICYVNPVNPSEAVLRHASRGKWAMLLAPLVFIAIGVVGIWGTWRRRHTESIAAATATAKSAGLWVVPLIGLVFFIMGTAFNFALFVPSFIEFFAANAWPETDATVVASRVRHSRGSDSTTYAVDILYRYQFDGREYHSNRYDFFVGSSSGRASKQAVVSRFRTGATIKVFVNPRDPVIAVITREAGWWMLFALLPTTFMLIGGGILVGGFLSRGKRNDPLRSPSVGAPSSVLRARSSTPAPSADVIRYSSGKSRRTQVIAIGIFALFWNAIVWTGAFMMWWGNAGIFPLLFISIFLLIGLGAIALFVYCLLGLFNPALELEFSHAPLRLGDTATAKWSFNGRFDRITRLTILIQGREEATYRRGTTTSTDKKIFRTLNLVDTAKQIDIARGQIKFIIPADTVPSFSGSNNKIVWEMIVKGEISNWPDVKEEIPLHIHPSKQVRQ